MGRAGRVYQRWCGAHRQQCLGARDEACRAQSQELFVVGNPRGGRTAAILASLTSSCRRHEMDPQLYFMQLLMNLPSWLANDLDAWLPGRWRQAHTVTCEALELPPLDF